MSQRIVITIAIDVPAGASVSVSPSAQVTEHFDDVPFPTAPAIPAPSRPLAAGPGSCPVHGVPFEWKEGGVSKTTGNAYDGFYKCGEKNADGSYCKQRPPR
jgi:hypothetical protein